MLRPALSSSWQVKMAVNRHFMCWHVFTWPGSSNAHLHSLILSWGHCLPVGCIWVHALQTMTPCPAWGHRQLPGMLALLQHLCSKTVVKQHSSSTVVFFLNYKDTKEKDRKKRKIVMMRHTHRVAVRTFTAQPGKAPSCTTAYQVMARGHTVS